MKKRKKLLPLALLVLLVGGVVAFVLLLQPKPSDTFAAGGKVKVLAKAIHGETHFLLVDSLYDWSPQHWAQSPERDRVSGFLTLECTPEEYEQLQPGDVAQCLWTQSTALNQGVLGRIDSIEHPDT